jgi:hypothetical protein
MTSWPVNFFAAPVPPAPLLSNPLPPLVQAASTPPRAGTASPTAATRVRNSRRVGRRPGMGPTGSSLTSLVMVIPFWWYPLREKKAGPPSLSTVDGDWPYAEENRLFLTFNNV